MITATGIIIVILLYVIPLFLLIHLMSTSIVDYFIKLSVIGPGTMKFFFLQVEISEFMVGLIYISMVILIFLLVRFLLYMLQRYLYITRDWDLYDKIDEIFTRYDKGLGTINFWGRLILLALVILMFALKIYDVRILVFAVLINLFVFQKYKIKKRNKDELWKRKKNQGEEIKVAERNSREDTDLVEENLRGHKDIGPIKNNLDELA